MKKKFQFIIMLSVLFMLSSTPSISAHGVKLQYESEQQYKIVALFDNGDVMDQAQVTIYAPDHPREPWATGVADDKGVFYFTPEAGNPGHWIVQVRKAGHGGSLSIEVNEGEISVARSGYSTGQTIVMISCVLWGLAGTALYFRRTA